MKLTKIVQQQRQKDRYSVYVDDKYAFSLSEAALLEAKLATGMELDAAELRAFKKLSADDKAYNRVLRYAALRPRSEWELTDYMRRKQVEEVTAQKILGKLRTLGFIDDAAFARSWVENRRLLKPVSKRRLVQELRQKRVSDEVVREVLEADVADEADVLAELVTRKRRQTKYQDPEKLMQYLARQGFNYDDIKTALAKAVDAED
jgi:regulatory protein